MIAKRFTKKQEEFVRKFLKTYIRGFIFNDINKAIKNKANYLVAMGLMSATELFGGLLSGKLGIREESKANFNKALSWMKFLEDNNYYSDFKIKIKDPYNPRDSGVKGIYELVRCGLIHEYFIKGTKSGIVNDPSNRLEIVPDIVLEPRYPGVWYDTQKRCIYLYTNFYKIDLSLSIIEYQRKLLIEKDHDLLSYFFQSIDNLKKRKFTKCSSFIYWTDYEIS